MLTFLRCVDITSGILNAAKTLIESRFKSEYFTRNRKMPFHKLLKFLLSMFKFSAQAALNKFFEEDDITMSQQALSKARNKFNYTPFLKIFQGVRDEFYSEEFLNQYPQLKATSPRFYLGKLRDQRRRFTVLIP